MSFRTKINHLKNQESIRYDSKVLFIGSCFSVNIGQRLKNLKYQILQNPTGITFNPRSILTTIRACISSESLPENELFFHNGLWKHSNCHGKYNHPDKNVCYRQISNSLNLAHQFLMEATHIFITLGTAYVYKDIDTGSIVNNCHKRPADLFNKRLLTIEEIENDLNEMQSLISKYAARDDIQFIITVSPVRHIKDGIVENQRSKSRLIEATHNMVDKYDNVSYFPAYELLLDDLRDYRFYNRDMVHPSEEAIDYIYSFFIDTYLHSDDKDLRHSISKLNLSLSHRPQFPDTEQHRIFQSKLINQMNALMKAYPFISYNEEIANLK